MRNDKKCQTQKVEVHEKFFKIKKLKIHAEDTKLMPTSTHKTNWPNLEGNFLSAHFSKRSMHPSLQSHAADFDIQGGMM